MEFLIVNLSNIDKNLFSHPNYSYKNHIENIIKTFSCDKTHYMVSIYHDVGKLTQCFQNYIKDIQNNPRTKHSFVSALYFLLNQNNKLNKKNFAIFLSILLHHNNLINVNDYFENHLSDLDDLEYKNPDLEKKIEQINHNLKRDVHYNSEILAEICEIFDNENFSAKYNLNDLDNYFFIRETFSKLIFADKYEAIFREHFNNKKEMYKPLEFINRLNKFINKLKENKLTKIRNKARNEVIKNYFKNPQKRVFIIEAPTGIGKTFIALHLALEISKHKKKSKIITALPMTSIIDQTFKEYSKIIPKNILLKYHYLTVHKNYSTKEEDSYDQHELSFISRSWAFDSIVITTFNQILNCFFSNKNRDLIKLWTLRNSIIILDEIQNLPRILLQDISRIINFLSRNWNIDFILMSATIPAIKKFLDTNIKCELLDTKYYNNDLNKKYQLNFKPEINTIDKLVKIIKEKSKKYNSIICVVNTKKRALKIFKEIQKFLDINSLFLLSTYFIPIDREKIIKKINERLKNNKKTILISTQVIEAGVDLDFEFGIREFAPLSSIIQAAGRVNRESKKENAKFIVTDNLGFSPYHKKDMLRVETGKLISEPINSNKLLKYIKQYFEIAINKTTPDTILIPHMEKLNFEQVYRKFNNLFMPDIPGLASVFIEIEKGLHEKLKKQYIDNKYKLLEKSILLKRKMEILQKIKNIYKEMSPYLIQVPEKSVSYLNLNETWENSGIHLLDFNAVKSGQHYSSKKGWLIDYEVFF